MRNRQFIFALIAGTALGVVNVYAGTAGDEGVADACGTGCSYTISEDGKTLTITGTGENASVNDKAFSPNYESRGNYQQNIDSRFSDIENVVVTGTISSIGASAFRDNNLTSVTIPGSVTSIGDYAFGENNLTSVTIPDSVTSIGQGAFQDNNLTSVTIPGSVTSIGSYAFEHSSIEDLTILATSPDMHNGRALSGMQNLKNLTITDTTTIDPLMLALGADGQFDLMLIDNYRMYLEALDSGDEISIADAKIFLEDSIQWQGNLRFPNIKIHCVGDVEKCRANTKIDERIASYFQDDLPFTFDVATINQKNPDGSTSIYTYDGKFLGYKNKRIYTIDEANQVAGKVNSVKIRYR